MIRRLIFAVIAALGFAYWLRGLRNAQRGSDSRAGRGPEQPRADRAVDVGPMVRDRVCNTFLPRSRALTAHIDGTEHFFCSEGCRRSFLEGHQPAQHA
ncbi:MAG: hypothetical protein GY716_04390 [bacterium]|nr:hypothetical protein [bacterium]